jgi:transcription initiation factor TFIIH subunit 2
VAELPGACRVCRLTLVSSSHLARSYHHLFPVPPFDEMTGSAAHASASAASAPPAAACFGCGDAFEQPSGGDAAPRLRCPACVRDFCFACDAFVHEQLHNCPGCEAAPEACC